jgi:hypothetical protein
LIEVPVPSQESEWFNPSALQSKVEGLSHSLSWVGTGTSIKSGASQESDQFNPSTFY